MMDEDDDLKAAYSVEIHYIKPNGKEGKWTPDSINKKSVVYNLKEDDLDVERIWYISVIACWIKGVKKGTPEDMDITNEDINTYQRTPYGGPGEIILDVYPAEVP